MVVIAVATRVAIQGFVALRMMLKEMLFSAVKSIANAVGFFRIADPNPGLLCRCAPRNDGTL